MVRLLRKPSMLLATSFLFANSAFAITLEEATYIAIENNPEVHRTIASYRERGAKTELAHDKYYPSLDLKVGLGREITYDTDTSLNRRETALTFTQPLFDGYETELEVERNTAETEAGRWEALIAVENTALEVAEAYANVLRQRELVQLAEINLDTHDRIYSQIKLKSDAGVGRQSDLSQITARLAKAHANRLAAVNNLQDANSQYNFVVGELPPEEMIYPVPDRDLLPISLEDAIDQAMTKNPAIEGANWDVKATESFREASKSYKYPKVEFVLERTWDNNLDGSEGPSEDLLAMIRLDYNLYNGGASKEEENVAVYQNLQATEIRRNTLRGTELTVRLAWAAYIATREQKEHIRTHVIATKESQIAYEKQFRLGRRTLLDVLDSENELFQSRQDYVNADYDELFSEFRLFNAKGELMRAFRIYRPTLLGFDDEFEDDSYIPTGPSAIEELEAAESELPIPVTENGTLDSSQPNDTEVSEDIFNVDPDTLEGGW
jgi:adhesin transport system outer membrane protein